MYHLCSSDASVLLTTEYAVLAREMDEFCAALISCGAQPVFFFDGVSSDKKRRTQIKRRREDVRVICTLNSMATSKNSNLKKPVGRILPVLLKEVLLEGCGFFFFFFFFLSALDLEFSSSSSRI
jgi:ribosomal protein L36